MQFIAIILVTALGVVGDYFLKLASAQEKSYSSWQFVVGAVIFALTAFGWVYTMKHMKLAEIGVVYSATIILMLALVGLLFFKEKLGLQECIGIILAIGAVFMFRQHL